jgi:hypothetical protein
LFQGRGGMVALIVGCLAVLDTNFGRLCLAPLFGFGLVF